MYGSNGIVGTQDNECGAGTDWDIEFSSERAQLERTKPLPRKWMLGYRCRLLLHSSERRGPRFRLLCFFTPWDWTILGRDKARSEQEPQAYSLPVEIPPSPNNTASSPKSMNWMALCDRLRRSRRMQPAPTPGSSTPCSARSPSADAADLAANWQRLAEHFDTLFTTEASIDALADRAAVGGDGKLSPQNPNDEPASKLLKRIGQERARLEAGGTCKKIKVDAASWRDEQPFEVPESWVGADRKPRSPD